MTAKAPKTKAELKLIRDTEQIAMIKQWPKRLEIMAERAVDPLKEVDFCRRYNIDPNYFNRMKRLEFIAKKSKTDPVEAAFKKEGV